MEVLSDKPEEHSASAGWSLGKSHSFLAPIPFSKVSEFSLTPLLGGKSRASRSIASTYLLFDRLVFGDSKGAFDIR